MDFQIAEMQNGGQNAADADGNVLNFGEINGRHPLTEKPVQLRENQPAVGDYPEIQMIVHEKKEKNGKNQLNHQTDAEHNFAFVLSENIGREHRQGRGRRQSSQ